MSSTVKIMIIGVIGVAIWYFFIRKKEEDTPALIPAPVPATGTNTGTEVKINPKTNTPQPLNPKSNISENPNGYDYSEFTEIIPSGKVKMSWMGLAWNPALNQSVGKVTGGLSTEYATVRNIGVKYYTSPITGIKAKNYYLHKSYIDSSFGKNVGYKQLQGYGVSEIVLVG